MEVIVARQTLESLGRRIGQVDDMIVDMLAARQGLAERVGHLKNEHGDPIWRRSIEKKRIAAARARGVARGLNPDLVTSVVYAAIKDSCMRQVFMRDNGKYPTQRSLSFKQKRANLLALTKAVAEKYDNSYALPFSTRAYLRYERIRLEAEIELIPRENRRLLVDLGCGTGSVALKFCDLFGETVGYDVSPDMLARARATACAKYANRNVRFEETDLELGIPQASGSASFVVCTFGAGSDFENLDKIIAETMRILEPGGRFAFSFYNKDALLYQWPFIPWEVTLAARVNLDDDCLDVLWNKKVYRILAHARSMSEVAAMFTKNGAQVGGQFSHPTVSPLLPVEAFIGETADKVGNALAELDDRLAFDNFGAYILITGEKNAK